MWQVFAENTASTSSFGQSLSTSSSIGGGCETHSPDAGQVLGDIARLPDEVRQLGREVGRVLPGARADLEHALSVAKHALQDREDRRAVALACFRERLHPVFRNR